MLYFILKIDTHLFLKFVIPLHPVPVVTTQDYPRKFFLKLFVYPMIWFQYNMYNYRKTLAVLLYGRAFNMLIWTAHVVRNFLNNSNIFKRRKLSSLYTYLVGTLLPCICHGPKDLGWSLTLQQITWKDRRWRDSCVWRRCSASLFPSIREGWRLLNCPQAPNSLSKDKGIRKNKDKAVSRLLVVWLTLK